MDMKKLVELVKSEDIRATAADLSRLWGIPYEKMLEIVKYALKNSGKIDIRKRDQVIEIYGTKVPYSVLIDALRWLIGIQKLKEMGYPLASSSISDIIYNTGRKAIESMISSLNNSIKIINSYYQ